MYQNILLTVDLNDEASWAKALPAAIGEAKAPGATLHVVSIVPDFGVSMVGSFFPDDFEEKALAETREKLAAFCAENVPSEIEAKNIVRHGNVYKEILEIAGEIGCDLIVIGAHRPALKDYLLGPNAARVVRHANCSVLVVRD
jgi:nucleotide-binding universal stress UspA family protein